MEPASMMQRLMRQCRPILVSGNRTESVMLLYELVVHRENSRERLTSAPEITQPPDTIDCIAAPRRSGSSNTNLAGGDWTWYVYIGQSWSYRLSWGVTETSSIFASQNASSVPTSRQ